MTEGMNERYKLNKYIFIVHQIHVPFQSTFIYIAKYQQEKKDNKPQNDEFS